MHKCVSYGTKKTYFAKNLIILNDILNKLFSSISNEHKDSINNNWISVNYEKIVNYEKVLIAGMVFLLIIFIISLKNRQINNINSQMKKYIKIVDENVLTSSTDLDGNITYVNSTFCEISGYSKEELIGKPHSIVRHPDSPKELFKELWSTIKNKKVFKANIKNRKKDGSEYFVSSTIVPILDNNGDIIEYLSLRYDISELVKAKEKAQFAEQVKSTFLANMSHEIKIGRAHV